MNELRKFCMERKMTQAMEEAFVIFCRTGYAEDFNIKKEGETIKGIIEKLTREEVELAWQKYVREIFKLLPTESI